MLHSGVDLVDVLMQSRHHLRFFVRILIFEQWKSEILNFTTTKSINFHVQFFKLESFTHPINNFVPTNKNRLYLNWQLILQEYQFWRLITCFLFFGTFGLAFFWNTYVLVFYCSTLEEVAFRGKAGDFLWMLLCGAGMLLLLTFFMGQTYFISGAMVDLMTYLWGRRNSSARLQVFFFTVRAPYLPWVLAFISLMMGGNIQDHLMGISVRVNIVLVF